MLKHASVYINWDKIGFDIIKYLHSDDLAKFFLKSMIWSKYFVQDCLGKNFIRNCIDFRKIAFILTFYRVFSWKNAKLTKIKPIFYKLTKFLTIFSPDNLGQNILDQLLIWLSKTGFLVKNELFFRAPSPLKVNL